jgi:hypothetical protein
VWATATVDLTAFAGQTVRLLVSANDSAGASLVEASHRRGEDRPALTKPSNLFPLRVVKLHTTGYLSAADAGCPAARKRRPMAATEDTHLPGVGGRCRNPRGARGDTGHDPGAGAAPLRRPQRDAAGRLPGGRRRDDGGAAGQGAGQAAEAAQRPGARARRRLRPLVDPAGAKTVDALGEKTGAWKTTTTYDAADINTANLRSTTPIVLDSTTGCFLDDPNDKARPTRGAPRCSPSSAAARGSRACTRRRLVPWHSCTPPPGAGRGGGRGHDRSGRVEQDHRRLLQVPLERSRSSSREDRRSEEPADRDVPRPAVRDPRRDLHVPQESFSRKNVHVLTSVDYDKMSAEDKAKEPNPRTDHDYALELDPARGQGRLFYEAHGHHERYYAVTSDAGAHPRRHPVRDRRSQGGLTPERQINGCPEQHTARRRIRVV